LSTSERLLKLKGDAYSADFCVDDESFICHYATETPNGSACFGDSGGPPVEEATDKLLGVLSGGIICGDSSWPSIYTSATYYYDWIDGINSGVDHGLSGAAATKASSSPAVEGSADSQVDRSGHDGTALEASTVVLPIPTTIFLPAMTRRFVPPIALPPPAGSPVGSCLP